MSRRENAPASKSSANVMADEWVFAGLLLLLALAPLLFWRELYDSLSVPKRAWIQVGAFVLAGLALWRQGAIRPPQPVTFFAGLFLLWALFSLTWATNPWLGWWTWWQWTACLVIGWVVSQLEMTSERRRWLLWSVAGSGTLVALIGLAQVWFRWGWVPQAISPGATLANRNMAAQVMVMVIPLAGVLVYVARNRREFAGAMACLTLCLTFLGHTFTKGCWIAFAVSAAFALAVGVQGGWRPCIRSSRFKGLLGAVAVAAVAINVTADGVRWRWPEIGAYLSGLAEEPENASTEADRLQAKSSRSVAVRTIYWSNTLEMIREYPVRGVGLNNWRVHYPAATLKGVPDPTLANSSPERTHNDLLQIWAELGTVGLLLALTVLGLFVREVWKGLKRVEVREDKILLIGGLAALVAIAVDSLFSFPLDREIPPLLAAVLVAGVLRTAGHSSPRPSPPQREGGPLLRIMAFVVIAGALAIAVWHGRQWRADALFKQQLAAMRQARWEEAVRLGEQIQQLDPARFDAWRMTGRARYQLGQFDEAWMDLKLVHQYVPDDIQLLFYLSQCAQKRGRPEQAEEALRRAATIVPGEAMFPHHLGLLYLAQTNSVAAVKELLQARELSPEDATVHFNLGLAYEQAGQVKEAIASYQRAVELNAKWDRPHLQMGLLLKSGGEDAKAKKHLRRALELNPALGLPEDIKVWLTVP